MNVHLAWGLGLAMSLIGAAGFAFSEGALWNVVFVVGALLLAVRAALASDVHRSPLRLLVAALGVASFILGAISQAIGLVHPPRLDTALGASGAQLFILSLTLGRGQGIPVQRPRLLGFAGHAVAAFTSLQLVSGAAVVDPTHLIWYAVGFVLLLLEVFWIRRAERAGRRRDVEPWEVLFLGIQSTLLVVVAVYAAVLLEHGGQVEGSRKPAGAAIRLAVIFTLALMADPPPAPSFLRAGHDTLGDLLLSAFTFASLVNVVLLSLFLASDLLIVPLFILLTGWLVIAVLFDYTATLHALVTGRAPGPDTKDPPAEVHVPVTALVVARNEETALIESVPRNLENHPNLHMILVPASSSTDQTVAVAEELARRYGDRVRVILGRGGSKAADLNHAWPVVGTEFVLILDADEVLHPQALGWALAVLEADPEVGIVQGRKAARRPHERFLSRFITPERRFSTRLDQWLQGEVFDAAHFAGSVALLRRSVPASVGGWSTASLTEDIEFTIRLYLGSSWRIVYEPRMVGWEANPATFGDLLRQRSRWARGWAQVYRLQMAAVLRNARELGARRTVGITWKLVTAISASWSIFLPAIVVLWFLGGAPIGPGIVGLVLGVLILPSRSVAFLTAYFGDPLARARPGPLRFLEVILMANLWVLFGWMLQLHALYQEISKTEERWLVTGKEAGPRAFVALDRGLS